MKKRTKIILAIVAVILIGMSYYGYQIFKVIAGSEEISGKQDGIPTLADSLAPLSKGESDWPNWRGAKFDGKTSVTGIKTDWSKGLEKLWQIDFLCQSKSTASWASPVVQGNRLIVPGRDEKEDLVFCLNPEDGKLMWLGKYIAEAGDSHGPGARATPFIDSNRVYTFGRSGDLACWKMEDGKLLWKKNVKELGGQEPQWGYSSTPLVLDNKVIVQGGGKALVIAYDKMTGDILWKSLEGEAGYSAAIPINIENEIKLLVYHGLALSCLDFSNGKELWRIPWETKYFVNATTPAIDNDVIFISSGYGMGSEALKVKKDGVSVLWKNADFAAQHSDPYIINGYIYGYSGDSHQNRGDFKCIELATGKEMWSTSKIGWGTTAYADGYLICLDIKGNLFLIKPDPSKFEKIGEIKAAVEDVNNPAWTVPVIANGKLYLRYMQRLVCYNLKP